MAKTDEQQRIQDRKFEVLFSIQWQQGHVSAYDISSGLGLWVQAPVSAININGQSVGVTTPGSVDIRNGGYREIHHWVKAGSADVAESPGKRAVIARTE